MYNYNIISCTLKLKVKRNLVLLSPSKNAFFLSHLGKGMMKNICYILANEEREDVGHYIQPLQKKKKKVNNSHLDSL